MLGLEGPLRGALLGLEAGLEADPLDATPLLPFLCKCSWSSAR